jgi:hypothetical protein
MLNLDANLDADERNHYQIAASGLVAMDFIGFCWPGVCPGSPHKRALHFFPKLL